MKTILHAVHIHAATPTVYDALTTTKGLTSWWTTRGAPIDDAGVIHFTFGGDFDPLMKQTTRELLLGFQFQAIRTFSPPTLARRKLQVLVPARVWKFKSSRPHRF